MRYSTKIQQLSIDADKYCLWRWRYLSWNLLSKDLLKSCFITANDLIIIDVARNLVFILVYVISLCCLFTPFFDNVLYYSFMVQVHLPCAPPRTLYTLHHQAGVNGVSTGLCPASSYLDTWDKLYIYDHHFVSNPPPPLSLTAECGGWCVGYSLRRHVCGGMAGPEMNYQDVTFIPKLVWEDITASDEDGHIHGLILNL